MNFKGKVGIIYGKLDIKLAREMIKMNMKKQMVDNELFTQIADK